MGKRNAITRKLAVPDLTTAVLHSHGNRIGSRSFANIKREEGSNLILTFARVLYGNGESTQKTVATAKRLGDFLGLNVTIIPRWGGLDLLAEDTDGKLISAIEATPSGVHMERVASTRRTIEEL